MKNKRSHLHKVLLSVLAIACLVSLLPDTVSAAPGYADVIVLHHYEGIAAAVQENKQLEAGEYALSSLFVLTSDTAAYKVYEVTGTAGSEESVTFEEGYEYTINIYYTRVSKPDGKDAEPETGNVSSPTGSSNPTTGDDSNFSLMMIPAFISLCCIIITAAAGKYKKQS